MKAVLTIAFGFMFFIVAASMFMVGSSSSHLSELKDVALMPVLPGLLIVIIGVRMVMRDMGSGSGGDT